MVCSANFEQRKDVVESKPIDLWLRIIKPLGASWMVNMYNHINSRPDMARV